MSNNVGDMRFESKRRKSFSGFLANLGIVSIRNLGKIGFYYTGWLDDVVCCFCKIRCSCQFEADVLEILINHRASNCEGYTNAKNIALHDDVYDKTSMTLVRFATSTLSTSIPPRPTNSRHCPRFPKFSQRLQRHRTFNKTDSTGRHDKHELAKAGFFFGGVRGQVRCYSCGIEVDIELFSHDQTSLQLHSQLAPNCHHIKYREHSPCRSSSPPRRRGHGVSQHLPAEPPSNTAFRNDNLNSTGIVSKAVPENSTDRNGSLPTAKYEVFGNVTARLNSFRNNWPTHCPVQSDQLAEAGFFNIVIGDTVRCAYCKGILRHWMPGDDPWVEHARIYPHCPYVLHTKGPDFVDRHKTNADRAHQNQQGQLVESGASRQVNPGQQGTGQGVCCTYCGRVLGQRAEGDDRWAEHRRWRPNCACP